MKSKIHTLFLLSQASLHARKEEISKLVAAKKDMEVQVAVLEEETGQLREELGTKVSGLVSKDLVVQSMEGTLKDRDSQLEDLQLRTKELKQDLVHKQAELTASNSDLSSLMTQNTELQKQVATVGASISEYKTELASKENLITSMTESYESRISEMTQKQSSLELANNLVTTLTADKSDLQMTLQQVRQELTSAEETSSSMKDSWLNQVRELQLDVESHQRTCTAQEAELAHNENTIRQLNATVETLQLETTKQAELDEKRTGLELIIDEKNQAIVTIKEENLNLKEQIHQQKVCHDEVSERLDTILKKQKSQLDMLNEKVEEVKAIEAENLANESMIGSLLEEKNALKEQLLAVQEELKRQVESNTTKHQELQELLTATEKKVDVITADRKSLSEKLTVLHAEMDVVSSKYSCLVDDHEMTLKSAEKFLLLEEANATLLQQCAQLENDVKVQKKASDKDKAVSEHELQLYNAQQTRQTRLIDTLTRENNKLMLENKKVYEEFAAMEERDRKGDSMRQKFETALAMEKATSCKLNEHILALEAELDKNRLESPPHGLVCSVSLSSTESTCLSSTNPSTSKPLLGSDSNMSESRKTFDPADEKNRVRELRKRNKRALPHLKSSYPIEMQVQPKTSSTSDTSLYDPPKVKSRVLKTLAPATSVEQLQSCSAIPVSSKIEQRKSRKRDRGMTSLYSQDNIPSSKPLSAPPTPQTPADRYKRKRLAVESLCPSLNLRDFLDEPDKKTQQNPGGTAFEVAFSPPKVSMPKRLRESRQPIKRRSGTTAVSGTNVAKKKTIGSRTRSKSKI